MMKNFMLCVVFGSAFFCRSELGAQEQPVFPQPQQEHTWLQQFAGEWDSESEGSMGPDQPPVICKGTMSSRMLGEFWVVNEIKADLMGTPMTGLQTIGYDSEKKAYVGTWVDSMMSHMWKYEGAVDKSGKILTLGADGPNFMTPGKTTKYQDIYEFKSADHIIATSKMMGEDGKWVTIMTGNMKRKKTTVTE